ncbi:MAG: riboflavin biosynthesis protein RibF [Oscillospiraceae bacterium]|nr:riboflavin biosynthesis protein RibF [Oscillospiraceae bacterium]
MNNEINILEISENETKTSVALGMFDGLHLGHAEVIKTALSVPDFSLTPAVFTFNSLPKAAESIMTAGMKFALLKSMGIKSICAPEFETVSSLSAEEFVDEILVDRMNAGRVTCGWNFKFAKGAKADTDDLKRICAERGIEVVVIPPIIIDGHPVNSTLIRELIRHGDIKTANLMLGRELMYELPVVEGGKLARRLGAPTINQNIPAECIIPKFGVYKSRVTYDVINYIAVTNIGVKPTVGGGISKPIMETHIPGFNTEVYGHTVKVKLLNFIREEKKFDSLDALKEQIQIDIKEACS